MMTVRFPSGFSIQYNDANYADRHISSGLTDLYTKKDGKWLAQVPTHGCVLELVEPCRIYNALQMDSDAVRTSLDALSEEVRLLKRKMAVKKLTTISAPTDILKWSLFTAS
ncbi:MAG: hypothetical protein ACRELE_06015 [Gemmatimonadales bacterium]